MPDATARSPIHEWFQRRQPVWKNVHGTPLAVQLQSAEEERTALDLLALCDMSALQKLGIRGGQAEHFIADRGIGVPTSIYESQRLTDDGLIVRLATDEFILESGISGDLLTNLSADLVSADGQVFRVERQEATFLLTGSRATELLAQTCSINFREAAMNQLMLTRMAGVNCGILPETAGNRNIYRFWVDYTYAAWLWSTMAEIAQDLDGCVVGAGCLYPELY